MPDLPLRERMTQAEQLKRKLPDDVLDATALRELLAALTHHYRKAIRQFDKVFGARA